jgi:PiT family inorganic phosphate transporter
MVGGWLLTVPAAAIVGGAMWIVGHLFGLAAGSVVEFLVLLAVAGYLVARSRREAVGAHNVTDAWEDDQPLPLPVPNVPVDLVQEVVP